MEWQRLSETFIVPADLPTMASLQLIHDYYAVGPNVVGDYLDYCSPTIDINGPTDTRVAGGVPPYFDGTLPHCKWEGTANASISASNGWANQESLESIAGVPDVNGVAWSQTTVLSTSSPDGLAVWYHPGTHAAARWCYAGYNGVRTVIGTGNGVQIVGVNGTTLTPSQTFNTSAPIDRSFVTATRLRGGTSADLITRLPSFQYLTSAVSPAATFVVNQADVIPGGLVWAWAKPVSDTQVQRILNWIGRRYAVA
jgi:hypothetical protein